VRDFELRRKRAGHLLSKSRFTSAQLLAYIETGVWRRNAERADRFAQRLAAAAGQWLQHPAAADEADVPPGARAEAPARARGRGLGGSAPGGLLGSAGGGGRGARGGVAHAQRHIS